MSLIAEIDPVIRELQSSILPDARLTWFDDKVADLLVLDACLGAHRVSHSMTKFELTSCVSPDIAIRHALMTIRSQLDAVAEQDIDFSDGSLTPAERPSPISTPLEVESKPNATRANADWGLF